MKKQNILYGVVLIGIGAYFLLNQFHFAYAHQLYSWPTILIFIGIAFLIQSHFGKDPNSLFPAVILIGLGIHFHAVYHIPHWPSGWPVYLFIVGLAFIIRASYTKKNGFFMGLILIIIGLLGMFDQFVQHFLFHFTGYINQFWPILLILIGIYILIKKK